MFSLQNHSATHAPITFSVYLSEYLGVSFSFQLFLAAHHSLYVPSKILSACDAKLTFQMLRDN